MTYDDIVGIFFAPPAPEVVPPAVPATPARQLRDALEPIATHGWWARQPSERIAALGLGFFDGYVWGRAASLGTPAPSVVVATFGVFEPTLLTAVYQQGVAAASRDDVLRARATGAAESLATFVSQSEASAVADPLLTALAGLDGLGRPLFSALRELPLPASAAGRLWRSAELVREHRGDGHLAACAAAGLDAVTANVLTELWLGYRLGEYSASRGFGPDRIDAARSALEARGWLSGDALTDAGRTARDELEATTDTTQEALVSALGVSIEDLVHGAAEISDRLVVGKAFPSDPRRRAAG